MHFSIELVVPKTATKAAPAVGTVIIPRGIISQIDIISAPGVNGLVLAQLYLEGVQIYPNVAGYAYRLVGNPIIFRDNYPTFVNESHLDLRCWCEGTRFPHTIQAYINVLPFSNGVRRVIV